MRIITGEKFKKYTKQNRSIYNKRGSVRLNVTLRGVHVTLVVVEKQ
jgi:hypothetical protein